MLLSAAALGFSSSHVVIPSARSRGTIVMGPLVFIDGADIKPKPDADIAGGSVCSQIAEEGMNRLNNDEALYILNSRDWESSTEPKNVADMKALAIKQNPIVGFYDPLNIINEDTAPETIGWFRHAEIKHGRVAMAGFVGYCFQANGIVFPWNIQAPIASPFGVTENLPTVAFSGIAAAGSPPDQWDALPTAAKLQIICVVGFLEMWSETSVALEMDGQSHYVRGGKPGYFPRLTGGRFPHPVPLNLWDPFGFTKKMSEERKEKALLAETNNGRLAMIGMFGALSASKGLVVPGLDNLGFAPYGGEIMAPFTAADNLPFVSSMAQQIGTYGYSL